jgi:hypothetical protein
MAQAIRLKRRFLAAEPTLDKGDGDIEAAVAGEVFVPALGGANSPLKPPSLRSQLLANRLRRIVYCGCQTVKGGHSSLAAVGGGGHLTSAEIWRE